MRISLSRLADARALTEHCGWKLQVALCVDRQPTQFAEFAADRAFREFAEAWRRSTLTQLNVPKLSTIESKITHKITPSKERKPASTNTETEAAVEVTEELDELLAREIAFRPTRRRTQKGQLETKQVEKVNVDGDLRNVERLAQHWLFLALKHRLHGWMLPTADLYHGDGLRQTLQRLCAEQLGESYTPYFIGYAPFFHRTLPVPQVGVESEIKGNKIFYFRARHVPGTALDIRPQTTDIVDHAWHYRSCNMANSSKSKTNSEAPRVVACAADPCYRALIYVLAFVLAHFAVLYKTRFDVNAIARRSVLVNLLHMTESSWAVGLFVLQAGLGFLSLCVYASRFVAAGSPLPFILHEHTDLVGHTAVVTGGTSGVGRETALQLLLWRCKVVIIGRDKTKGANAVEYLRQKAKVGFEMIQYVEMDLNDKKSIATAAAEILRTNASIDFLINNAGVAQEATMNAHKMESMFAANFLGHFYFTKLLMGALKRDKARIINVSSLAHYCYNPNDDPLLKGGHTMQLPRNANAQTYYARSKLFNIWHAQALQRRFDKLEKEHRGVVCFSAAPGIVATPLLESYTRRILAPVLRAVVWCFTKTPRDGANTILYLCSAPLEELTPGGYYYECKLGYVSKHAQDAPKQEALYELAEKMLKT
ncbi:SHORT-CHAIN DEHYDROGENASES/REDUCTASE FAMILY MEMBER protein, putative [Babesia bigemina]|uniref:SHORT-CHAIN DEHYDROGENASES/REDUCTASE FAMILY MEMBER protein, putative n=1 Tax=Babesia bigemina TaxID=5866 RepID=A0A061DA42_BABBI|nr:SHORT-CHAIN DEHYDROGENASES/REDUCTASE FAMILY MEMBER protein, putative [Babesia bigemina]CDR96807.1 SHORT-CHAIN DEHYDROGENASES/REDUCTASE FAMILY MEMBER protein, putative [Babesia bigemina]|eukprot:XP_012768993.1 SHORT-CHAIN DEHYDROGENASES/REDUCTASE FAMILY MEMBER protein, putative [Babesia bigemina]